MARFATSALAAVLLCSCVVVAVNGHPGYGLQDDYYQYSCPQAESVITQAANAAFFNASNPAGLGFAASFLRMTFHDCFVEGCDGSIFLDGPDTEKTSEINKRLFGWEVIDNIKAAVEAECPGVVSCADLLQYAARDGVVALNGSSWKVQGGRKDGVFSSAAASESELPSPDLFVPQLLDSFGQRGLSAYQLVVLSGAHTVGVGHCDILQKRLYEFSQSQSTDPSLDQAYADVLKATCPQGNATTNENGAVPMDVFTPRLFNSDYYKGLLEHKGLFTSDENLYDDGRTQPFVQELTSNELFLYEFGQAMRAMAAVGIRSTGQVRTNCRQVNDY